MEEQQPKGTEGHLVVHYVDAVAMVMALLSQRQKLENRMLKSRCHCPRKALHSNSQL